MNPRIMDIKSKMENTMEYTIAEWLNRMPAIIKNRLENAAAEALGFRTGFGKWEVDHCNSRSSTISQLVSSEAQKLAKKHMDKIFNKLWKVQKRP